MSLSAATIDALVAAGVTAEQLAAAVKAELQAEADKAVAKRARAAEKKRKQRALSLFVPQCPGDKEGHVGTEGDNPRPLPSSPQTPQQPTPTPENNTRTRKAVLPKPSKPAPDLTERVWQSASKASRDRSGRPALGKAVLAAIRLGATDEALIASVRDHCLAQGEFAKGIHHIVNGEHWRDHSPKPDKPPGATDPRYRAHLQAHFAATGEWLGDPADRPANHVPSGKAA